MKLQQQTPRWHPRQATPLRVAFRKRFSQMRYRLPALTKRAVDLVASGAALLFAAPLLALIAVLIRMEDGGPVLFWQNRVGRHGRIFRFPKFRSMVVDAEAKLAQIRAQNQHGEGITFKMKTDPRITRIGRWLRRFSLDEAPQLWCVFRGDMSLVGPRPALPHEVARYSLRDRRRLDAIPGLTCIWQVSGRSNLAFPIQCRMDSDYIETQSLKKDIEILVATVPAVLTGRGAY